MHVLQSTTTDDDANDDHNSNNNRMARPDAVVPDSKDSGSEKDPDTKRTHRVWGSVTDVQSRETQILEVDSQLVLLRVEL